jgi:FkbM family methyltransferase
MGPVDRLIGKARGIRAARRHQAALDFLGPHVEAVIVSTDQGDFAVRLADRSVSGRLRHEGSYGLDEIAALTPLIEPTSRVLVVGAHVGTLAIPLARTCAELVAIEANPDSYRLLTTNIALNHAENVRAVNIAASDTDTPLRFLLNTDNSGGSKRKPLVADDRYTYDDPTEVTVSAARLDDVLDGGFGLILMDIEGSEHFALQGMPRLLDSCHTLVVEFVPHHLRNVADVSVSQFLEPMQDRFTQMTVPMTGDTVAMADAVEVLERMYEADRYDDGLIFRREV